MVFKSKIDWFFKGFILFFFGIGIVGSIFLVKSNENSKDIVFFQVFFIGLGIFYYILMQTTDYTFKKDVLYCRSVIFRKSLPYSSIRKIEVGTKLYGGLKFSTSLQGLIIHYNKFDDLFISPEKPELFIEKLVALNPSITIIRKEKISKS
jgi:hypothetical protein